MAHNVYFATFDALSKITAKESILRKELWTKDGLQSQEHSQLCNTMWPAAPPGIGAGKSYWKDPSQEQEKEKDRDEKEKGKETELDSGKEKEWQEEVQVVQETDNQGSDVIEETAGREESTILPAPTEPLVVAVNTIN